MSLLTLFLIKLWTVLTHLMVSSYTKGRLRLDNRKNFIMERLIQHWNGLPRGVVKSPHPEVFRIYMNVTEQGKMISN